MHNNTFKMATSTKKISRRNLETRELRSLKMTWSMIGKLHSHINNRKLPQTFIQSTKSICFCLETWRCAPPIMGEKKNFFDSTWKVYLQLCRLGNSKLESFKNSKLTVYCVQLMKNLHSWDFLLNFVVIMDLCRETQKNIISSKHFVYKHNMLFFMKMYVRSIPWSNHRLILYVCIFGWLVGLLAALVPVDFR